MPKKPMVKLNKKVYGEAVDKAFEANKKAREKNAVKKTTTKMPAVARPTAKKPTLDDFIAKKKKVPSKNKKYPGDTDVKLSGFKKKPVIKLKKK
jgi:hypothetical protein